MTALSFFGAALTAFGPALSLFVLTIAHDPVRIIVLILSAFFWLLSLLFSSLFWTAVYPLQHVLAFGLVFSILFQELFRFLLYVMLRKADRVMRKLTENEHTQIFSHPHILAYVVGLGFGIMSGAFSLVNVLADSVGPGTVGFQGESQNFVMVSASLGLALILCHTFWGVITFVALDDKKYHWVAAVWMLHYLFSCLTLLNPSGWYVASVLPAYVNLGVSGAMAFHCAGGSWSRLVHCLPRPNNPTA